MIMLATAKSILAVSLLGLISTSQATTYNVIAAPPANMAVAVVVDKTVYPLTATYGILYKGEAPSAKDGYNYAIVDTANNNANKITESFLRAPLKDGDSTLNEFFNRSITNYELKALSQALEPLPSIHRIESDLHIPNQIPTIHIYGNKSAIDYIQKNQLVEDLDVKLSLTYFGLKDIQTFENVKVSLAGRSSRWVPKLSYGFKFDKKDDATLFGFKNFKLRALANDPSYIRENVCYNVLKSSGIPASGFSYVRVFIDNQPVGLYGLIETFQDPWCADEFANGEKNYESRYLYQGIGFGPFNQDFSISDLRYEGTNITKYAAGQYKIKAGHKKKSTDSYADLQEFTKFINDSTVETTPESEWEKRLDVDGFLRAMTIENLLGFSDGYMTLADNYYLYKNPNPSGRMTYIPADLDTTIGISLYNLSSMISGNYADHPGIFFRPLTIKIFSYPSYLKAYQELLLKLTQTLINPSIIDPYIDSVVNMIRTDVEWDAALPKVGERTGPPFAADNSTQVTDFFTKFVPPGFNLGLNFSNISDVPWDVTINGPYPPNTLESVKGFIAKKSSAILDFYKQK